MTFIKTSYVALQNLEAAFEVPPIAHTGQPPYALFKVNNLTFGNCRKMNAGFIIQ